MHIASRLTCIRGLFTFLNLYFYNFYNSLKFDICSIFLINKSHTVIQLDNTEVRSFLGMVHHVSKEHVK